MAIGFQSSQTPMPHLHTGVRLHKILKLFDCLGSADKHVAVAGEVTWGIEERWSMKSVRCTYHVTGPKIHDMQLSLRVAYLGNCSVHTAGHRLSLPLHQPCGNYRWRVPVHGRVQ